MILVVDNYDSFTWNIVHYLRELGAEVRVVRNDEIGVASAMASGASVTVSMAAEISGMLRRMLRVSCVARLTSRGSTLDWAGTSNTSSNVNAFCSRRIDIFPAKANYTG